MLAPPAEIAVALRRMAGKRVAGEARTAAAQSVISFANLFEAAFAPFRDAHADPRDITALLHRLAEQAAEHAEALAPCFVAEVAALAAQWQMLATQIGALATHEAPPARTAIEFELHRAKREWSKLRVIAEQVQGSSPATQEGGDFP